MEEFSKRAEETDKIILQLEKRIKDLENNSDVPKLIKERDQLALKVKELENKLSSGGGSSHITPIIKTSNTEFKERMRIVDLLHDESQGVKFIDQSVVVSGWVKTIRDQKEVIFVALNDGSCYANLQIIADSKVEGYQSLLGGKCGTGASLLITGVIVKSPAKGQTIEMQAKKNCFVGRVRSI